MDEPPRRISRMKVPPPPPPTGAGSGDGGQLPPPVNSPSTPTAADDGNDDADVPPPFIPPPPPWPEMNVTLWKCRRQLIASLIMYIACCNLGSVYGWSTIAVHLMQVDGELVFSEPLMNSIYIFGALVSGPVAAYSMTKLGRKYAMLCHTILLTVGWTLIPFGAVIKNNDGAVAIMYIGRIITGFAGAGCLTITHVYIGEICCEAIRPLMGSLLALFLISGNLLPSLFGLFVNWVWLTIVCWTFPLTASVLILILKIPDSPQFLLARGKVGASEKACRWLAHGFTGQEQDRLFKNVQNEIDLHENNVDHQKAKFTSRPVIRPIIVSVLLMTLSRACGVNVILIYSMDILKNGKSSIAPKTGTVLIALCFAIFVGVAALVINRVPRKTLLQISCLTEGAVLCILGVYFSYIQGEAGSKTMHLGWVPFVCGLVFMASFAVGLGSIVWVIVTDINYPAWQEVASSITTTTYWLINLLTTMTYPGLRNLITRQGAFWLYACVCFAGSAFVHFCLFETRGVSYDVIMKHYEGSKHEGQRPAAQERLSQTRSYFLPTQAVTTGPVPSVHRSNSNSNYQ